MIRQFASRLLRDSRGAALVEFAMISPLLIVSLMGLFDMGYNMYMNSLLQGAIQKAARDSTIENAGASASTIDAKVTEAVHDIVPGAVLTFTRKSYTNFSDVGQPEDYSDVNKDGTCDNGEPFEDANGNGIWDADRGSSGQGGARDAVLYTVIVTYARAFPIAQLIGQDPTWTGQAQTVLRNQPYGLQASGAATAGNCA